ncbi:MAG: hypothetical protein H7175_01275, partial [Burkholderiales bacterium]|nr:hypothetical protein [Anaerolineae bacterium]
MVRRAAIEVQLRPTFLKRWPWRAIPYVVFILFMVVAAFTIGTSFLVMLAISLVFGVFIGALLEILLHGTSTGGNWANLISTTIAAQRQNGMYELLSGSPDGALGICWLICQGCASQRKALRWFRSRIFYFPLVGTALALLHNIGRWLLIEITMFPFIVNVLVVMVALHIHYLQAAMMGCIVGMLTPTFDGQPMYARMSASGLF